MKKTLLILAMLLALILKRADATEYRFIVTSSTTSTDVWIDKGDKVVIRASGSVSTGAFSGASGPEGKQWTPLWNIVQDYPYGCLLAGIEGDNGWYFAGIEKSFVAEVSGWLLLRVNDTDPSDNYGSFNVTVQVGKSRIDKKLR